MARYLLEGEWTGYTSAQRRVCHREVISDKRASNLKVKAIVFTDGTSLILYTRPVKPREKVVVNHQYNDLIKEAEATGKSRVLVSEL